MQDTGFNCQPNFSHQSLFLTNKFNFTYFDEYFSYMYNTHGHLQ